MKCPYQTKTESFETKQQYCNPINHTVTLFADCRKNDCPFYYNKSSRDKAIDCCLRAEKEASL